MSSSKRSGQPLRLNASEATRAIRAGEMLDQLMGRQGSTSGKLPRSLMARVRNAGTSDIPAWGLCRWFGDPVEPATIGGTVPELVLRTVTDTTRPLGVAINQIKAAASPNPAEIGQLQVMGVCWARARGPIAANDYLMPDSSFRGIRDTTAASNVKALSAVASGTDAIIPVLIDGGGVGCSTKWQVFSLFGATAGTITLSVGVKNSGGTTVTEYVVINWNDSSAAIKAAFVTHSLLDSSDVTVSSGLDMVNNFTVTLPAGSVISGFTNGLTSNKLVLPEVMVTSCCT